MRSRILTLLMMLAVPVWAQASAPQAKTSSGLAGRLVNTPGTAAWNVYGVNFKVENDKTVQGGQALRITTTKGANPWSAAASAPLTKPVKKGDVLLVAFWARLQTPPAGSPTATLPVGVSLAGPPYTGEFGESVTITGEWTIYFVSGTVGADFAPGKLNASIQLAADAKTVDLGPMIILDYGPNYDLSRLPHNKAVASPASPVATAQSAYADGLAKLRARLSMEGTLLSDSGQAPFGYGSDQTSEEISAPDIPGGKAERFTLKPGPSSWSDGAGILLKGAINAGDSILMAMYVRIVAPPAPGENGTLKEFGVSLGSAPWTPIAVSSASLPPGQWRIVYASGVAQADYASGALSAGMQLGCCTQTIDIGPIYVLDLGQNAALPVLPQNGNAVLPQHANAASASQSRLAFVPFKANDIYAIGEQVGWTVTGAPNVAEPSIYTYKIFENGAVEIGHGVLDLSKGSAKIAVTMNHPASIYVTVDKGDGLMPGTGPGTPPLQAHYAVLGAVVAPTKIKPAAVRPADFDAFWAAKIAQLNKIPINPILIPLESKQSGVKLYRFQLDSLSSHVQGYLAVPDKQGPFPAFVQYQWAGVYPLDPSWITGRAAQGWLAIDVDSHDEQPDQAMAPQNYPQIGDTSRDTSYFLAMYLRDTRALEWVRTLAQWNRKTLVLDGGSMGGQQSLVTAGLNPGKESAVFVDEPSGSDVAASLHGRMPAYPDWQMTDLLIAKTAPYFDTANFTPKITAPTMVAIGLIDSVCPPTSIFSAVNRIPGPHEIVPMPESEHMMYTPDKQEAYIQRSEAALTNLLHGGRFMPDKTADKVFVK
jgi:cephalosporin-C deacetylase-like acetyl esterase